MEKKIDFMGFKIRCIPETVTCHQEEVANIACLQLSYFTGVIVLTKLKNKYFYPITGNGRNTIYIINLV